MSVLPEECPQQAPLIRALPYHCRLVLIHSHLRPPRATLTVASTLPLGSVSGETKPQRAAGLRSSPATRALTALHSPLPAPSHLVRFQEVSGELIPDAVVPPGYLDIPRIK